MDEISQAISNDRGPWYAPGDRVQCIRDIQYNVPGIIMPKLWSVYTIRSYAQCTCHGRPHPAIAIYLVEIKNKSFDELEGSGGPHEPAFWQGHFVKVLERKVEIEIGAFRRLFRGVKEHA